MIRPLTIATFLMACGSGLYLYQVKHESQVLDRTIEKTVRDTAALREQSRVLSTEWTMLNDPDTLRHFSDTYLSLKPIAPSQFTSLADLDSRLPPVRSPAATSSPGMDDDAVPEASVTPPPPAVATDGPELPPNRSAVVAVAAAVRPVEKKSAPIADRHPIEPRPIEQHIADARSADPRGAHPAEARAVEARPDEARTPAIAAPVRPTVLAAAPRPTPPATYAPAPYPSAPYSGSLLGMARSGAPSVPRPTPVNATQWSNPN